MADRYLDAATAVEAEDEMAVRLAGLPGFRAMVDRLADLEHGTWDIEYAIDHPQLDTQNSG